MGKRTELEKITEYRKKEVHGMVVGKDGKLVDAESLEGFKGYGQP